jgi:hypothetical protein
MRPSGGVGTPGDDGRRGILADLSFLGDPDELRAAAERHVREYHADPRKIAHFEGADTSGSIWVMVERRGRVESVEVIRHWRERLAVAHFATALADAYGAATRHALTTAAVVALTYRRRPGGRMPAERIPRQPGGSGPDAGDARPSAVATDRDDPARWLRATRAALDGTGAELDRLDRLATARRNAAGGADRACRDSRAGEQVVASPSGYLTLRLRDGRLDSICGDVRRIAAAGPEQLRLDALAAFRAAGLTSDN